MPAQSSGCKSGGIIVPRIGSRVTLTLSLVISYAVLLGPVLAPNLVLLTASLFLLALANSVVDVSMSAQGIAVEHGFGKRVLSSMHAMHSLGGIIGAGIGAWAGLGWIRSSTSGRSSIGRDSVHSSLAALDAFVGRRRTVHIEQVGEEHWSGIERFNLAQDLREDSVGGGSGHAPESPATTKRKGY
jgi:hypothetical protein